MSVNSILKDSEDLRLYVESTLDNTIVTDFTEFRSIGGCSSALGGTTGTTNFKSNAFVSINNKQPKNNLGSNVMIGGLSRTESLPSPYQGSGVSSSMSAMNIINTKTSDSYSKRSWEDKVFSTYAGDGSQTADNYELWFDGRFAGHNVNSNSVSVAMAANNEELFKQFPSQEIKTGDSAGDVDPYIFGSVKGHSPKPYGNGVYRFHSGTVETYDDLRDGFTPSGDPLVLNQDLVFSGFPCVSMGEGTDYAHDLNFITQSASGGTVRTSVDYSFTQISDTEIEDSTDPEMRVSCDPQFKLVADGSSFSVINANPHVTYKSSDFDWKVDGNGFFSNKGVGAKVSLSGDVVVSTEEAVGGRWFKVQCIGSGAETGTVTIEFDENILNVRPVIRSINTSFQTIDNYSKSPDSVTPSFTTTDENHTLSVSNVNSNSWSFDYSVNLPDNSEQEVAFWFEEITLQQQARGNITFTLGQVAFDISDEQGRDFTLSANTDNDSQNFYSLEPSYTTTLGAQILDMGGGQQSVYTLGLEMKSGIVDLEVDSITVVNSGYGISYDGDNYTIKPQAVTIDGSDTHEYIKSELIPLGQTLGDQTTWNVETRSRLVRSSSQISLKSTQTTAGLSWSFATINEDWTQSVSEILSKKYAASAPREYLSLGTWRGDLPSFKGAGIAENSDVDFTMEIDWIRAYPITGVSENIRVYSVTNQEREELYVFRVVDAKRYANKLPRGVAVYDSNGFVCVAPSYQRIVGDFNGGSITQDLESALSELSLLALGENVITNLNGSSPNVGFALSQSLPFIDVVQDVLSGIDWFYRIDLVGNGVKINKRYNYPEVASDFYIGEFAKSESQYPIVSNSVVRNGSEQREQQYIVYYNIDLSDDTRSKIVKSNVGSLSGLPTKTIRTVLVDKSDAEQVASTIGRDSAKNGIYSLSFKGIGSGVQAGHAGLINHEDIPLGKPCLIKNITENTANRQTQITFKLFHGA